MGNPFHTHAAPPQHPGEYPPTQAQHTADDAQLMSSHAQHPAWPAAEQMQSQMPMIPPMHQTACDSQGYAIPRHVTYPHGLQDNSAMAFIQQPGASVSHGLARGLSMSHELMQQGSDLMVSTSHALHGLTKDYCVASVNVAQSQTVLQGCGFHKAGEKPSQVEIVDVTDSIGGDDGLTSTPAGALPFPSVALPFEVP